MIGKTNKDQGYFFSYSGEVLLYFYTGLVNLPLNNIHYFSILTYGYSNIKIIFEI